MQAPSKDRTAVRSILVSDTEARSGSLSDAKHRLAEILLACRGYVVLENALSLSFVAQLREAFDRIYGECTKSAEGHEGKIWPPRDCPASGAKYHRTNQRWRIQPRLVPPMSEPELLANPLVMSLLRTRLGAGFHCRYVSSDTCAPGAELQAPHSDVDTRTTPQERWPCGYVMNVPLVACGLHNGPLEVWPGGSHLWAPAVFRECGVGDLWIQDERNPPVEEVAEHFPSEMLTLRPGDILLRDPAMWHRGTPNGSQESRTMLTVGYFRDDYFYVFGDTSQDVEAFLGMADPVQRLFEYRFNLGKSLFWKALRCPWPGSTRISVPQAAAMWARWRLTHPRDLQDGASS